MSLLDLLSHMPNDAQTLARIAGRTIEETYAALVHLHDEGKAELFTGPGRDYHSQLWDRA